MTHSIVRACAFVIAAAASVSCLSQDIFVESNRPATREVTLHVLPDTATPAEAAALGWTEGIPDIAVIVTRDDSARTIIAQTRTDAAGKVTFGPIPQATYIINVDRVLTDAEKLAIGPVDVEGYALRSWRRLGQFDTATVIVPVARRASLVISEWSFSPGFYVGVGTYDFGGFLELYNNTDTTLYLDGILIANAIPIRAGTPEQCARTAHDFIRPNELWVFNFDRFPGSGRDYPMVPGHAVVIATDAIDHRPLFQNAIDLRNADFEFHGEADVDNPTVPNMIELGPSVSRFGQGTIFQSTSNVVALVRPTDVSTLERKISAAGIEHRRVSKDLVIDAIAIEFFDTFGFPQCERFVDPTIVLDDAPIIGSSGPDPSIQSVKRRAFWTRSDGRQILQNTRSSRTDLLSSVPRTPGVIP